jgi:hypothetical protein
MAKRRPLTLKVLESRIRDMERTRRDDAAMVDLVRRGRIAEIEERNEAMALILRLEARVSRLEDELRLNRERSL